MSKAEQIITELEAQFPALASIAFAAARQQTLDCGLSVLEAENGVIYETFPDGRRVERKRIEPPTKIPPGTKFTIC